MERGRRTGGVEGETWEWRDAERWGEDTGGDEEERLSGSHKRRRVDVAL